MQYYKRLPLANVKNVRDLGGIPTIDGKLTKWGRFLRTASLDDITMEEINFLKEYGVESVIDLRRENEIPFDKDSHKLVIDNFSYNHISLSPDIEMRQEEIQKIINKEISIGSTYRNLIDNFPKIKEIMEVVEKTKGITLFHCQEGKDRTGIVSMILLGLAGVSRSDIIADYEVSAAYLGYVERYEESEPFSVFRITNPYYMREAYEYIARKYHSFEEYLSFAGVRDTTISEVKNKLLN